jgi:hypothetical protein
MNSETSTLFHGDAMTLDEDIAQIMKKLERIETDLSYIKDHMIDADTILTAEERANHSRSMKEYARGRTYTLDDLEGD